MEVLAWSENLTEETAADVGARKVSKEDLSGIPTSPPSICGSLPVPRGQWVSGNCGFFGPEGLLVNTSRGPLVQQDALVRALNDGWIRGAALDVFDIEPIQPAHPLLSTPNTVLSPHLGYVTQESYRQFYGAPLRTSKPGSQVHRSG